MIKVNNVLFVCFAMLISSTPYAQTSVNPGGAAASATVSNSPMDAAARKKAIRAANSRFSHEVLHAIYGDHDVEDPEMISVFGNAATGQVVLAGYITNRGQEDAAVKAARQGAGVTEVTSKLTLEELRN